jgi:pyruvate-formate lyase-activating enzyme
MHKTQLFSTIDFHVTCECSQECTYCWGPQDIENPVSTSTSCRIIKNIKDIGAKRIVFTGGDPLKRKDIGQLIRYAKNMGLEVALSTTGDELTKTFLRWNVAYIDLISLPIDGSTEEISSKTKEAGHLTAVLKALEMLKRYPSVDVKICTPVTKHNIKDVPNILKIAEGFRKKTKSRVFYNIFQTFPRSLGKVDWGEIVVSNRSFAVLKRKLAGRKKIKIVFLDHKTLDKLYLMIFPNGNLVIPEGGNFTSFGSFLEIENISDVINQSKFEATKHLKHSKGWEKRTKN